MENKVRRTTWRYKQVFDFHKQINTPILYVPLMWFNDVETLFRVDVFIDWNYWYEIGGQMFDLGVEW